METKVELLKECESCIYFEPRCYVSDDISYNEVISRKLFVSCVHHPMFELDHYECQKCKKRENIAKLY